MRVLTCSMLTILIDLVVSQSLNTNRIGSHRQLQDEIEPCGFEDPGEEVLAADVVSFAKWKSSDAQLRATAPIPTYVIPVYFHIIAPDQKTMVSDARVWEHMKYLNESFEGSSFVFALQDITGTTNEEWSKFGHAQHMEYKAALKRGGKETLNIYITERVVKSDGTSYSGFAFLPSINMGTRDGIVIANKSGNKKDRMNTLVHEVGHWLGLLHTFAGDSCDAGAFGDLVDDTPQHKEPPGFSLTCNVGLDSCKDRPGTDPVHNFMTYSSNKHNCRRGFTEGQFERMRYQYEIYRKPANDFPAVTVTPTISPMVDDTCAPLFGGCEVRDCCVLNCRGGFWIIPHFCFL